MNFVEKWLDYIFKPFELGFWFYLEEIIAFEGLVAESRVTFRSTNFKNGWIWKNIDLEKLEKNELCWKSTEFLSSVIIDWIQVNYQSDRSVSLFHRKESAI